MSPKTTLKSDPPAPSGTPKWDLRRLYQLVMNSSKWALNDPERKEIQRQIYIRGGSVWSNTKVLACDGGDRDRSDRTIDKDDNNSCSQQERMSHGTDCSSLQREFVLSSSFK